MFAQATGEVWLYNLGTLARADPASCTQCGWLINVSFRPAARLVIQNSSFLFQEAQYSFADHTVVLQG